VVTEIEGETTELKAALAETRTQSSKLRTGIPKQIGETIEFQAQLPELKGASAKQKAVTAFSLSQTITAIYDDFDYFVGAAAGLAALVR
jgi:hypothetical protein